MIFFLSGFLFLKITRIIMVHFFLIVTNSGIKQGTFFTLRYNISHNITWNDMIHIFLVLNITWYD
jgi:hypothetical protein